MFTFSYTTAATGDQNALQNEIIILKYKTNQLYKGNNYHAKFRYLNLNLKITYILMLKHCLLYLKMQHF
jgi:hypothetical protein